MLPHYEMTDFNRSQVRFGTVLAHNVGSQQLIGIRLPVINGRRPPSEAGHDPRHRRRPETESKRIWSDRRQDGSHRRQHASERLQHASNR